jgi:hypothetical protein
MSVPTRLGRPTSENTSSKHLGDISLVAAYPEKLIKVDQQMHQCVSWQLRKDVLKVCGLLKEEAEPNKATYIIN